MATVAMYKPHLGRLWNGKAAIPTTKQPPELASMRITSVDEYREGSSLTSFPSPLLSCISQSRMLNDNADQHVQTDIRAPSTPSRSDQHEWTDIRAPSIPSHSLLTSKPKNAHSSRNKRKVDDSHTVSSVPI